MPPTGGSRLQRLAQVGDELVRVLDADRQADEAVADAESQSFLRLNVGVRGCGWPDNQRLHPTQAHGNDRDRDALQQALGGVKPAGQLET